MIFVKKSAEAPCRVIGIGSPHGADRLGWRLCELLRERWDSGAIEWWTQAAPVDLPVLLAAPGPVILLDAMKGRDDDPVQWVGPEMLASGILLSSHGFGVAEALALAEALGIGAGCRLLGLPIAPDGDPELQAHRLLPQVIAHLQPLCGR